MFLQRLYITSIRYAGTILESSRKSFDRKDSACRRLKQKLNYTTLV